MRAQIQQLSTIVRGSLSNPESMSQLVVMLRSVAPGLFGGL
jgi:hypothetical protein